MKLQEPSAPSLRELMKGCSAQEGGRARRQPDDMTPSGQPRRMSSSPSTNLQSRRRKHYITDTSNGIPQGRHSSHQLSISMDDQPRKRRKTAKGTATIHCWSDSLGKPTHYSLPTASQPAAQPNCPLFLLPAELRNEIYLLVAARDGGATSKTTSGTAAPPRTP